MIELIGIAKDAELVVREKFAISKNEVKDCTLKLLSFCEEAIIISTCNRTEIYLNIEVPFDEIKDKVFNALNWDLNLKNKVFNIRGDKAIKHLFEVACGFHSKIYGEDQILGQIKNAYEEYLTVNKNTGILQRMFQQVISCGKEFRTLASLYEIPVSSSAIAVKKALENDKKSFLIIGYGDIGQLVLKYILASKNVEKVYIAVRNISKVEFIDDIRVKVIDVNDKNHYIEDVDTIIACTSSKEPIVKFNDVRNSKEYMIFDFSIPRNVEQSIEKLENVKLYNIDTISVIDEENKEFRKNRMNEYKYIINEHFYLLKEWITIREIAPIIKDIKKSEKELVDERITILNNKTKEENAWANKMINSTASHYVNRAIEVLKEEKLSGCDEKCIEIIKKIFLN